MNYAIYQGRIVEVLAEYGTPDGQTKTHVKIRDGSAIVDVQPDQLSTYSAPVQSDAPTFSAIFINQIVSADTLITLPSIQLSSAKKILSRRPIQGYKDMATLKELNSDLTRIDWNAVAPFLRFDPPLDH